MFSILIFLPLYPSFRKSDSLTTKISKYCLSSLFYDQFSDVWNMAINFQCFFEAFSGDLLAQSGDGAPALSDYPSSLSNFLIDQPFLFGNASL